MRHSWLGWLVCGVALLWLTQPCSAQDEKSLHWSSLHVTAQLDDDGRLRVRERHEMVFTGDWNGGYRTFRVEPGQELDLHGMSRIDARGTEIPLTEGDVDAVDHYEQDGLHVRWRSRLPTDPPFKEQHIVYVLDYTLSRILEARDDGTYLLNHDFAFPDREGVIENVIVNLAIGSQWQPIDVIPGTVTRKGLGSGETLIVTAFMRHAGTSLPAGVWFPPSSRQRTAILFVVLSAIGILSIVFVYREGVLGRFRALPSQSLIDEAWLQANLLRFLPEEAGAAWDGYIGAPEVAAIMARLVAEGKLFTELKKEKFLFLKTSTLKMRLTQAGQRGKRSYEATLMQKFFFQNRKETDTEAIRKHYKRSGFDPAAEIRKELETALRRHPDLAETRPVPPRAPILVMLVLSAVVAMVALPNQPDPVTAALVILALCAVASVISAGLAAVWREALSLLWLGAPFWLLPALAPTITLAAVSFSDTLAPLFRPQLSLLLGLGGLGVAVFANALRSATSRDTPDRLVTRQALGAARRYFRDELKKPEPRLRDEWFPYAVAFGLGSWAERWFDRFGPEQQSIGRSSSSVGSSSGGSSSSTGSTSVGGWTGGGGKFGGGGAGGSWVAAVGGVAAGVSRPSSSSSSGGGGGGGSSSGGGGGGGW